ncbi:GH92 family glycosyl hydrolase [bacterium]|nr:GH92 family glycosyl hydrolase [bacterium]
MLKLIPIFSILVMLGCSPDAGHKIFVDEQGSTPVDYVNPFIGTEDMGHMFPGATAPFGLVQLSPETELEPYSYGRGYNSDAYRYCSGYQYNDNTIVGFAHTHFNGTGHADLGDFLIMPTVGAVHLDAGSAESPENGYRSRFSHDSESASPGFYAVLLDDYNIDVKLTATERTGMHSYIFPESDQAHIILDLTTSIYNYPGKLVWASIRVENDTLITGYRQTRGWARSHRLYFAMALSRPIDSYSLHDLEQLPYSGFYRKFDQQHNFPERAGRQIKANFDFQTKAGDEILIKFALSSVSTANALENMREEIPGWDFDKVHQSVRGKWNRELSRIIIDADKERKINFYTALYHSFLSPVIYTDVNGEYRGLDENVHQSKAFSNHSIFSLWDTYRALHPLFTIIQQDRTNDLISSMLAHYDQSVHRVLPVWSHHGCENWCMIGYHAVPVIADAYLKGLRNYDVDKALDAMLASANFKLYDGIEDYLNYGYVPADRQSSSASKTLEYAYDDWTIARMAASMGRDSIADTFMKRAGYYKNIYDEDTGFLRARMTDGSFTPDFDPMDTHGQGYIEGNAWNYSLYVPHDIKGFIDLIGGRENLIQWLDSLFIMDVSDEALAGSEDVTREGMIGNYVHGNEPSHHVPYMYCYAGQPWKTQKRIHQIVNSMYSAAPDGLCGNDDCGQMSAWYIFSTMGFYPVAPGTNQYVIGSPCINKAELHLENGKVFTMIAEGLSGENIYIQSAILNGSVLQRCYLEHKEIMAGGLIHFKMGNTPNKEWASADISVPYSMTQ